MTHIVSCFNTGQITLPKKWRDEHESKKYIAEETEDGLLIKPLKQSVNVTYFDSEKEEGAVFPDGIDPDDLIKMING